MASPDYTTLVAGQRAYFLSGATRPAAWRVAQLNAVKAMINENRDALFDALWHDLRRNRFDADLMDVEFNVKEADHALGSPAPVDETRAGAHSAGAGTGSRTGPP